MAKSKQQLNDGGDYLIQSFFGLNTIVANPKKLADGEPQDSLNFITGWDSDKKISDNIQLRLGSALLCKTSLGAGKVNSLAIGQDVNGLQVPFFAAGGQYYYYNSATGDYQAVTNGTLTATEDMTLEFYQDLFGPYMYSGSPNTGINLISVSNKQLASGLSNLQIVSGGDIVQTGGYLTIRQNFGWLWNYLNPASGISYKENLNQSTPDQVSPSSSTISNIQGSTGVTGNGVLTSFSGTLPAFSPLALSVQIGAPINSLAITSVSIPSGTPFSSSFDMSINYSGGFGFNQGDFVVLQGFDVESAVNDCIGIVEDVSGTTGIAINFLLSPTVTPTAGGILTVSITNGGAGYTIGDILSLANGIYGTVQVANVSAGVITAVTVLTPGNAYTAGMDNNASGGTGTGAVIKSVTISSNVSTPNAFLSKLEIFEDDGNGNLKSLLGSSGTINYISGAFTINTQTAVPNARNIDAIYYKGRPGVITFSPGFWAQFGGVLNAVKFFSNQLYQFHSINTWLINLGFATAGSATGTNGQQQYRQNMGAPFFRSAFETSEGILFLDNALQNNPKFRLLQIANFSTAVKPKSISDSLDLSQNAFDFCKIHSIGNYDFLACQSLIQSVPQTYNDVCYIRNNISGFYDKTDFRVSEMDIYNGAILAGDTITNDVYQLFTGVDDVGTPINNKWVSGQMNLGFLGLKRFNYFYIDGYIGPDQALSIYAQFDAGNFVLIGSIYGNGPYVDQNDSIVVGQGLNGATPIGGQGNGQITGFHFQNQIPYYSPLFTYVAIKFVAGQNLINNQPAYGALQINAGWGFKDCRIKSTKSNFQYIGN